MLYNIEKVIKDIENQKEIISTLPVNTKKNKKIYVDKLKSIKAEYEKIMEAILININEEYENNRLQISVVNTNLKQKEIQLKKIKHISNVVDKVKTPYEKMQLDKSIYNLKRFYRKNLEIINEEIKKCVDLFKKVGVVLTEEDFNFSKYINQYMKRFFKELTKEDFNYIAMKEEFEKIYWESPQIIVHIQLNFRYLFLKNEKKILEFYNEQEKEIKKDPNFSVEKIYEKYKDIKKEYIEEYKKESKLIVDNFLNGHWNLKDYEEKSMNKCYSKFVSLDKLEKNKEEIDNNLIKLLQNLHEYENFLQFKYIFDDIKGIYKTEKGKSTYKILKKKIIQIGGTLQNTNRLIKVSQKARDKKLKEMEQLCEELDIAEVKEKIHEQLSEKSTLKEMSNFIISFYKYLFICIIKHNEDITEPEIKAQIEEFEEFAKYPYDIISESIIMGEDKDIALMIKDRYNLFDIKITKDLLDENNIRNLIIDLEKIENNYYINEAGIDLNTIQKLCKMKKIISENQKEV